MLECYNFEVLSRFTTHDGVFVYAKQQTKPFLTGRISHYRCVRTVYVHLMCHLNKSGTSFLLTMFPIQQNLSPYLKFSFRTNSLSSYVSGNFATDLSSFLK